MSDFTQGVRTGLLAEGFIPFSDGEILAAPSHPNGDGPYAEVLDDLDEVRIHCKESSGLLGDRWFIATTLWADLSVERAVAAAVEAAR